MRLLISMILILGLATVGDGPQGADNRAERLRAMRAIRRRRHDGERLAGVRVTGWNGWPSPSTGSMTRRGNASDGTVWVWCRSGRPAALLTLTKDRSPAEGHQWLAELTSLAPARSPPPIEGIGTWQPSGAGVVMQKFPKAPLPAEDATKRLRQMKELVRQIKAYETYQARRPALRSSATSFASSLSRFTVTRTRIPA